jgi:hypothetical protein
MQLCYFAIPKTAYDPNYRQANKQDGGKVIRNSRTHNASGPATNEQTKWYRVIQKLGVMIENLSTRVPILNVF